MELINTRKRTYHLITPPSLAKTFQQLQENHFLLLTGSLPSKERKEYLKSIEPYLAKNGGNRGNQHTGGRPSNDGVANKETITASDYAETVGVSQATAETSPMQG